MAWGIVVGPLVADPVHRLPPHRLALGGDVRPRPVLVVGTVDDLVVDVRHVGHELHVQAAPAQVADEHVVLQRRPAVPEVRRPVHRRPAEVDAHLAGLAQGQLADLARGRVVEPKHSTRLEPAALAGAICDRSAADVRPAAVTVPAGGETQVRLPILSGMAGVPEKPTLDGIEARWAEVWDATGVYRFDRRPSRDDVFSVDTPPPTVSGSVHMGTIFGYTQFDAMARYQRMRGKQVFFPIGWDDNGLATERRVQNFYGVRCDPARPYDADFTPPYRGDVPQGTEERPDLAAQLRRAVPRADGQRRSGVRGGVPPPRAVGRLVAAVHDDRRRRAGGSARRRSCATSPAARPTAATPRRCGTSTSRPPSPRPRSRTSERPGAYHTVAFHGRPDWAVPRVTCSSRRRGRS